MASSHSPQDENSKIAMSGAVSFRGPDDMHRDLLRYRFVPDLVSFHAQRTPDALALASATESVSYRNLEERANQLANYLQSLGVGPDVLVGVCLERSPSMAMVALAILRAGGAYVPLDPVYPPERLAFMLEDSRVPILITREALSQQLPRNGWKVVDIEAQAAEIAKQSAMAPELPISGSQLAYVIFTSGSDGHPKGVQITHAALLNLVQWHLRAFDIAPADRASQLASVSFDAAVWELWPYLTAGSSVHFCDETTRLTHESLQEWLLTERISISFVPTTLAERLMTMAWPGSCALRVLLTGADTLHRYPAPGLPFAVVNNYGPTECTVVATSGEVLPNDHPDRKPTIGRPIDNVQIHILDDELRPVPTGQVGEVYIGGAGLARGYRNRPDLDREKFIPSPFNTTPGGRLYRTGDLGRYLADGQIAFVGRIDSQIKIRGYRIEPNEIISVLSQHPGVQASVVVARDDAAGNKQLVGYVVPSNGAQLSYASLVLFAREYLPDYMVPGLFVQLDSLPVNSNGKVDRSSLPTPDATNIVGDQGRGRPQTAIEKRIVRILGDLLGIQGIGTNDNFFFLGGHSLLGTQLIARLRDAFGVELSLRRVFDSPTAAELATEIETLLASETRASAD
ncbi:MAG TPA: non-ribosomal peptide synthetase [Terriglobales bacterium]|nr:non-ribosomal peptide synthetase [Terriglobales bacterium]